MLLHQGLLDAPGARERPRLKAMGYRQSKAFETLSVRMLFLIGLGTISNLGYLLHLKSSGQFVPLELERQGYKRSGGS